MGKETLKDNGLHRKMKFDFEELQPIILKLNKANSSDLFIDSISTDSRTVGANDWFLCLEGERFDAHQFIPDVAKKKIKGIIHNDSSLNLEIPNILVEDTNVFLRHLANVWRHKLGVTIIGITGSNGKTSTKEILYHLISAIEPKVYKTQRNYNNSFGVPNTILEIRPGTQYAIIEMGTNHPGEIEILSECANPNHALITSIAEAHIEFFGSQEAIAHEKAHIIAHALEPKTLYNHADVKCLESIQAVCKNFNAQLNHPKNKLALLDNQDKLSATDFIYLEKNYSIPLIGEHQIQNLELCIALLEDIFNQNQIERALISLSRYRPPGNRLFAEKINAVTIWNDSYNANLASALASIEALQSRIDTSKLHILIGEMGELGDLSIEHHLTLSQAAKKLSPASLTFALNDSNIIKAFKKEAYDVVICDLNDNTMKSYADKLRGEEGAHLLLKGSRSAKLERVIEYLKE